MKHCKIRVCDDKWYWDMCSGNSDALCNEDSSDPHCSICELKRELKFGKIEIESIDFFNIRIR
jgi:hypothetical protein